MTAAKVARVGMFVALAMIFSYIEALIPFNFGIPGMKLGLANLVTVTALYIMGSKVALAVSVGTTLGFLLAGFAPIVVLRAAVQVIFVALGAVWLARRQDKPCSPAVMAVFGLVTGLIHGVSEAVVVTLFWFGGTVDGSFLGTVVGLVGVGTLVHSMVDFYIALAIWAPVSRMVRLPLAYRPKAVSQA